jgi:hypothetical protein
MVRSMEEAVEKDFAKYQHYDRSPQHPYLQSRVPHVKPASAPRTDALDAQPSIS